MKKLIKGIVEFRTNVQKEYRESFGRLATGQSPDTLFIACSDSRVVPNTFASTNPGDLFVLRNVGNLVPASGKDGVSLGDDSEAAAIEYAVLNLNISYIIVCGHSECAAMRALMANRQSIQAPNLKSWLRHGDASMVKWKAGLVLDSELEPHNQLSQLNVLQQMENIKSYPVVKKRIEEGTLAIHGWWFDIALAEVYAYEADVNKFVVIDESEAEKLLRQISTSDI
jgi:carbonic anhydrase